jgi:hypothetical protein
VQGTEEGSDGVRRHPAKPADLPLTEVALELCQVASVGIDGIAGEAAFDADMVEIALDESVRIHSAMIADDSGEDNATHNASNLDTLGGFRY